jgi:HSP20 family protein
MLMRPYRGWRSPWHDLERLRRDMNRVFADLPREARWGVAPEYPAMNLWTDENNAVLTAELPGVVPDDIDVSVEDEMLTLRGSRRPEELGEERRFGAFTRTFRLPFRVDANKVEATFQSGVLSVVLPRAEADLPRKIAVKTG